MTDTIVVNDTGELYDVINQKKSEGYLESELTVINKSRLHLNDLHDSEVSFILASGTFSDKMTKLLTGEDGEHAVLSHYNLALDELEKYKQLILDDKMLVVGVRGYSSYQEALKNNPAYEEVDITHFTETSKGPRAQLSHRIQDEITVLSNLG